MSIRSAKQAGSRNVEVLPIDSPFAHDIGPDPTSWPNACTATYYGLDSIVSK